MSNGFQVNLSIELDKGYVVTFTFDWEGKNLEELFGKIDEFNLAHRKYAEKNWPKKSRWRRDGA